ncbi:MAG: hypothetical protein NT106_08150 [Candidatus Sumerlaeota bacterium]|nr:hypothetical protein [Candidatus Sumerlaeota bacterium]
MIYYLGRPISDVIRIDSDYYENIRNHKANLIRALNIEVNFDILLGNYREFEEEILTMSLRHNIFATELHYELRPQRKELNRRIANFLSSARSYLDQLLRNMNMIYGEGAIKPKSIEKLTNQKYDNCFSYRLMEQLRNYVQHYGLAAPSISVSYTATKLKLSSQFACTLTPQTLKKHLLEDKEIKPSVRTEINALTDPIDLKYHIREYFGCINAIHNEVRRTLAEDSDSWEKTIRDAIDRFKIEFHLKDDEETVGLAIFKSEGEPPSTVIEKHDILMKFIEYRKHLQSVNEVRDDVAQSITTG